MLAVGLSLIGFAAFGQTDPGWVTLQDGSKMGDWDRLGAAHWRFADGAAVADKIDGKGSGFLVSKNSYKDFQIRADVDVAKVSPMPKAAGKWNTYDITAQGSHLVVVFNGAKTVDVQDSQHASGPVALQYGSGVVKFRKVQSRPP